jgi:hypothetical protein
MQINAAINKQIKLPDRPLASGGADDSCYNAKAVTMRW